MEKRPFAKQLIRHPFFAHVTDRLATIRKELKEEIQRQRSAGVLRRQAEVTTKHGQLKPDRKSKPQKIYMDDLGKTRHRRKKHKKKNTNERDKSESTFTFAQRDLAARCCCYIAAVMECRVGGQRRLCPSGTLLFTILTYPSRLFPFLLPLLFRLARCVVCRVSLPARAFFAIHMQHHSKFYPKMWLPSSSKRDSNRIKYTHTSVIF